MKLSTLYKAAKAGENVQWSIETKGDSYIETYGRVGGKMQENVHKCEPKNVGRSNETTAKQQAEAEAKAKWQSKLDKGYREDQDEVDDVPLLPMLAHSFAERKGKVTYPVYCQPKLNGVRCIAKPDGTLISRGGKPYILPHISEQVKALKLEYPIDGEVYIHGETLQDITSYVKKNHGNGTTEKLNLVVYDIIMDAEFERRYAEILKCISLQYNTDMVGRVARLETVPQTKEVDVLDYEKVCVKEGYEGCMVRTTDLMYENNHRSNNLLKVKSFKDDEFKVISFNVAQNGKVVWHCAAKNGKEFDCYHKSTLERGQWYAQHGKEFLNRKLTVKYFDLTPDGLPQFPVGLAFRDEKDL